MNLYAYVLKDTIKELKKTSNEADNRILDVFLNDVDKHPDNYNQESLFDCMLEQEENYISLYKDQNDFYKKWSEIRDRIITFQNDNLKIKSKGQLIDAGYLFDKIEDLTAPMKENVANLGPEGLSLLDGIERVMRFIEGSEISPNLTDEKNIEVEEDLER